MPGPTPDNTSLFPGVSDRVANLVVRYYDTNLSDEETAELRQGLTQHPAARSLFVHWGLQIQTLTESLAPQYSESDDSISFEELVEMEARAPAELVEIDAKPRGQLVDIFKPSHGSPRLAMRDLRLASIYLLRHALTSRLTIGSAIAAVLLLGLFVINPFASDTPNQTEVADNTPATPADSAPLNPRDRAVATLTASHNAQWAQHPAQGASAPGSLTPGTLTPGSKLHPNQRLTLTQGFAEITTARGAVAILQAPATIELLDNNNALHLHTGKLVGICETESSKGFIVRTPH